jgi:hypothetical protein
MQTNHAYHTVAQVLYNKKTEQILGVHIIGLHAADLIQECSNAMAAGSTVRQLAMMVSSVVTTLPPLRVHLIISLCPVSVADAHASDAERGDGRGFQGRGGHSRALGSLRVRGWCAGWAVEDL